MSDGGSAARNAGPELTDRQFADLLAFRTELRRFLRWSEDRAKDAGLTPAQHQLLLAVRGSEAAEGTAPSVRELSQQLLVRHHAVVALVDRAERAGLVTRGADSEDARVVRIRLTGKAEEVLSRLTAAHLEEIARLAAMLDHAVGRSAAEAVG